MPTVPEMMKEAVAHHKAGKVQQAEQTYRKILSVEPNHPGALSLLGSLAQQFGKSEDAIKLIRRSLATKADVPEAHCTLAMALRDVGELSAAITHFREAVRLKPDFADAHSLLSESLVEDGKPEEALGHSLEALRLKPDSALAFKTLGELVVQGFYSFSDNDLARMKALIAEGRQPSEDTSRLYFTLAAYWDKTKDYDEAFRCFYKANELKLHTYANANQKFDPKMHGSFIDRIIATFTPELFARTLTYGLDTEWPVFVVGMARSGTSLTEQILASHPQVYGAGELKDVAQITATLPKRLGTAIEYPECSARVEPAAIRSMGCLYLQRICQLSGAAIRIVDKMPHNYVHLGLIALLFPKARIIHCRREPMDTCLSIYMQNFKWVPYASRLEDIGIYHWNYERLMAHWNTVLPLRVHEVVYEEMVADQEAVSRKLIDFVGLDWDERCLSYYKTRRAVQTGSKFQVRQPIYNTAVARWKRYETHLEPLQKALAGPAGVK